jgi:hypothetical protein
VDADIRSRTAGAADKTGPGGQPLDQKPNRDLLDALKNPEGAQRRTDSRPGRGDWSGGGGRDNRGGGGGSTGGGGRDRDRSRDRDNRDNRGGGDRGGNAPFRPAPPASAPYRPPQPAAVPAPAEPVHPAPAAHTAPAASHAPSHAQPSQQHVQPGEAVSLR